MSTVLKKSFYIGINDIIFISQQQKKVFKDFMERLRVKDLF